MLGLHRKTLLAAQTVFITVVLFSVYLLRPRVYHAPQPLSLQHSPTDARPFVVTRTPAKHHQQQQQQQQDEKQGSDEWKSKSKDEQEEARGLEAGCWEVRCGGGCRLQCILPLLRSAARQAGMCKVARTTSLPDLIAAVDHSSPLSPFLHHWHSTATEHQQTGRLLQDRLHWLASRNRQLLVRLRDHSPHGRHAPWSPVLSEAEFASQVRAAGNQAGYLDRNPDVGVRTKISFHGPHLYAPRQGIGGSPLLPLGEEYRGLVEEVMGAVGASPWVDGLVRTHRLAGTSVELLQPAPPPTTVEPAPAPPTMEPAAPTTTTREENYSDGVRGRSSRLQHLYFLKPFAGLHLVSHQRLSLKTRPVHIVLPLLEDSGAFKSFVHRFLQKAQPQRFQWLLTVVYSGMEAQGRELEGVLSSLCRKAGFTAHHRFITAHRLDFGAAVTIATQDQWAGKDVITMVMNVHHFFDYSFVRRCQLHARRKSQGYFPISFGLYNPALAPPPPVGSYVSWRYGRWMDVEVGAFCLHRSDLDHLSARAGQAWTLPHQVLQVAILSRLQVVRSPDPALVRVWHGMDCSREGSGAESYHRCMTIKTHLLAPVKKLGEVLK